MRFLHISDLHLGKRLKEASLEDDQRFILGQIADIAREVRPAGVLIAGDVYDTTTPTVESVRMLDDFLTDLVGSGLRVYMISGNHDSPDKLGYASRMLAGNGLYISGVYSGHLDVHTVREGDEEVDVCLLPFIKPLNARRAHPEDAIESYNDAVRSAIAHTDLPEGRRRILVTHQFVVAGGDSPRTCDSESVFVGGTEAVDASLFDGFDYVALGHIHTPQSVGRETVRYCGTPLVYSKSEIPHSGGDPKSVTVVDIGDTVTVETIPLHPLRSVRIARGTLEEIVSAAKDEGGSDDYVYAELTADDVDAMARLRDVYPNILSVESVGRSREWEDPSDPNADAPLDMIDAFADFFRRRTGKELTPYQADTVRDLLGEGSE